ncbi:MAG TPA: DNA methyltransferase, partial [Thiobacillus sp.]|nr:DNA methyltransferase [Thiobacillus sp.]
GSGSTGCACVEEGRDFIGIDITREYIEIAERRTDWAREQNPVVQQTMRLNL